MKICILTHTFPKSLEDGTAAFMHSLAQGIQQLGNEVVVVTPFTRGMETGDFGYKVIAYKYMWPKFMHKLGYANTLRKGMILKKQAYILIPFMIIFSVVKLVQVCRKEKVDVISAHWILPNGLIAYVVNKILKVPYIITLPGSDVFIAKKNKLFSFLSLISANNASAIIADSPKYLEILQSLHPKIRYNEIIPYPVDMELFRNRSDDGSLIRKKLGLSENAIIILAVGRLIYKKGFSYSIQAMSELQKKHKAIRLIIVGDGDLRKSLEELVRKEKLTGIVTFVGNAQRDLLLSYYNMADIFVMSSIKDEEGNIDDQPVSLIEAMASGKPVVATNFPGISLTVEDGVSGFLVPEKNSKYIAKALEKLADSKELRKKMGERSLMIVKEKLSTRVIGSRYNSIFKEIQTSRKI